jgi:hypothetical protein
VPAHAYLAGLFGCLAFTSLSPLIGQTFFIGNGLTRDTNLADYGGAVQSFMVPTGATRLYLGTTDGFGWYNNNGTFQVDITSIAQAVPEPETYALMLAGLFAVAAGARRRKGETVLILFNASWASRRFSSSVRSPLVRGGKAALSAIGGCIQGVST